MAANDRESTTTHPGLLAAVRAGAVALLLSGVTLLQGAPVSDAADLPPCASRTDLVSATLSPYCPNLQALAAQDLSLQRIGNRTRLRFTTVTQNIGPGALELRGGEIVNGRSKQRVYQRIYAGATPFGSPVAEPPVGDFIYHPQHRHFHLENYARYELVPVNGDASLRRTSTKTSFCVQDTLAIGWQTPPYGTDARHYIACDGTLQGMSRGWADKYGSTLAGQEIDVTGLPGGQYELKITVNPNGNLYETSQDDNISTVTINLANGALR